MKRFSRLFATAAIASTLSWSAQAATLEATYLFDGSLLAEQSGAPALTAIDPLNLGQFTTANVFGQMRTVYSFNGTPMAQGGLSVSTASMFNRTQFSVEMVFDFAGTNGFRRVIGTSNRTTDFGIYVDPNDRLTTWTGVNNPGGVVADEGFTHVTLTVSGNEVKTYVNGVLGRTANTNRLHINNADTLHFFLDNTSGLGGRGEYSGGSIAFLRLYDGALSAADVASLAAGPLPPQGPALAPAPVPLPGSLVLLGSSLIGTLMLRRRAS